MIILVDILTHFSARPYVQTDSYSPESANRTHLLITRNFIALLQLSLMSMLIDVGNKNYYTKILSTLK